jgi:hypothetical protein
VKAAIRQLLQRPAGGVNVWQYTEALGSNRYSATNATKVAGDSVSYNGITLSRLSSANFFGSISTNFGGLGLAPFVAGQRYLMSYYVMNAGAIEQFFWMRALSGGNLGHGSKLVVPNTVRRVWQVVHALTTSSLTKVTTPTTALGSEAAENSWYQQGTLDSGAASLDMYIGGFQLEPISSTYKDGIAMIGDSTMAGSSAKVDFTSAREVSNWLGALLNVNVFNRAVGGETTDTMDARWATDITPLAVNCKYAVIQGGINDIATGRALIDIQASITSMVNKATSDGLTPVVFNCTPTSTIAADGTMEAKRVALNAWIAATFPMYVDIATAVANPANQSVLNPAWVGDGVHYTAAGKRIAGYAAAGASFWGFVRPTNYRRVLGQP